MTKNISIASLTSVSQADKMQCDTLRTGDRVVLTEDIENQLWNLTFCGKHAKIVDYPEEGRWMEIQLLEGVGKKLMWRKACASTVDGTSDLGGSIMIHIFSFLVGPPPSRKDIATKSRRACLFQPNVTIRPRYTTLKSLVIPSVSKEWHRIWKTYYQNITVPILDVLILGYLQGTDLQWFLETKPRLGSLKTSEATIMGRLLLACDTTDLSRLQCDFCLDNPRLLHNLITENCPRLQDLSLQVDTSTQHLCRNVLLQLPIRKLHLTIIYVNVEGEFFIPISKTLSQMKQLTTLELASFSRAPGNPVYKRCIAVVSSTLQHLDVTQLQGGVFVTCQCPHLQDFRSCIRISAATNPPRFRNNGSCITGTLPLLTRKHFQSIERRGLLKDERTGQVLLSSDCQDLTVTAGSVPFSGLDVPPACQCWVGNFWCMVTSTSCSSYELISLRWVQTCQESLERAANES